MEQVNLVEQFGHETATRMISASGMSVQKRRNWHLKNALDAMNGNEYLEVAAALVHRQPKWELPLLRLSSTEFEDEGGRIYVAIVRKSLNPAIKSGVIWATITPDSWEDDDWGDCIQRCFRVGDTTFYNRVSNGGWDYTIPVIAAEKIDDESLRVAFPRCFSQTDLSRSGELKSLIESRGVMHREAELDWDTVNGVSQEALTGLPTAEDLTRKLLKADYAFTSPGGWYSVRRNLSPTGILYRVTREFAFSFSTEHGQEKAPSTDLAFNQLNYIDIDVDAAIEFMRSIAVFHEWS